MRRKLYENVRYSKLEGTDDGFVDAQFHTEPQNYVPWRAICLAVLLFVVGIVMLIVGSLIVTGVIDNMYQDRMWPMLALGVIMFIPGAYHTRIAYYAYKGKPGYSFEDIPEFD